MKTILALMLSALTANAANFLFTTNQATALAFAADLDAACGYPNPATKTERAVAVQEAKGGWLVVVPDGVWAPKLNRALDAKSILPEDRKADEPATTEKAISDKLSALIVEGKVKSPTGQADKQSFVLVSDVLAAMIQEANKEPIQEAVK